MKGLDPSLLSPSASAEKLIQEMCAVNEPIQGSECDPNSACREDDDLFSEDIAFGDVHRAPRRRRQQTGFTAGLPSVRRTSLATSSSFGGMDTARANLIEENMSGSLSARGSNQASEIIRSSQNNSAVHDINDDHTSKVDGIAGNGTLKLSPRSSRNRSSGSPGNLISAAPYNPAESLFPSSSLPTKRSVQPPNLGIIGSDAPRKKSNSGDSEKDSTPRSRSPTSPRRHLGEYENKKSNKLTFV